MSELFQCVFIWVEKEVVLNYLTIEVEIVTFFIENKETRISSALKFPIRIGGFDIEEVLHFCCLTNEL